MRKTNLEFFVDSFLIKSKIKSNYLQACLNIVNTLLYNNCCQFSPIPIGNSNNEIIHSFQEYIKATKFQNTTQSLERIRNSLQLALGLCCNQGVVFGNFLNENFITDNSSFSLKQGTASLLINNGLQLSGVDNNFNTYAIHNDLNVGPNHNIISEFIFNGTETSTSYGLFFGRLSNVLWNPCQYTFNPVFDNSSNSGKLILRMRDNVSYNDITSISNTSISILPGSKYKINIQFKDFNLTGTFSRLDNNNNIIESTSVSYTYISLPPNDNGRYIENTGSYVVGILGGIFNVTNFTVNYPFDYIGTNVAFVGDSITMGTGATTFENGYVRKLFEGRESGKNYVTLAGPGDNLANVISRKQEIVNFSPKYAVINSSVLDSDPTVYYTEMLGLVDYLISNKIIPILISETPNSSIRDTILEVATLRNLMFIDVRPLLNSPGQMVDSYHPSDAGHQSIATYLKLQIPYVIY
jgi:hypothetical protein